MTYSGKTFELLVAAESVSYTSAVQHFKDNEELYLFEFARKGHGFVETASSRRDYPANSYFMIPPNTENSYWSAPGVIQEKIFFICRGPLVKSLLEIYELEKAYVVSDALSLVKYFDKMLLLIKHSGSRKDREAALVFHEFIQAAHLLVYQDAEPPLPRAVKKLQQLLDEHLEEKIDLGTLCREIAYSSAYLVRLFKKHMGVTPYEYILQRRLETAQLLLRHSTLSIKEIAERLVFSDQYHFSNSFRKRTGISPSRFRQS